MKFHCTGRILKSIWEWWPVRISLNGCTEQHAYLSLSTDSIPGKISADAAKAIEYSGITGFKFAVRLYLWIIPEQFL